MTIAKDRILEVGTRVVGSYRGTPISAVVVRHDDDYNPVFTVEGVEGEAVGIRGSARAALKHLGVAWAGSADGWRYWTVEGEDKAAGKTEAKAQKAADRAEAKRLKAEQATEQKATREAARAAKAASRIRKAGYNLFHRLEDNTWFCDACMDGITDAEGNRIVSETEPADCTNGHRAKAEAEAAEAEAQAPAPHARKTATKAKTKTAKSKSKTKKATTKTTGTRKPRVAKVASEVVDGVQEVGDGVILDDVGVTDNYDLGVEVEAE